MAVFRLACFLALGGLGLAAVAASLGFPPNDAFNLLGVGLLVCLAGLMLLFHCYLRFSRLLNMSAQFLNNVGWAVIVANAEGRIVSMSQTAHHWFDDGDQVVGEDFRLFAWRKVKLSGNDSFFRELEEVLNGYRRHAYTETVAEIGGQRRYVEIIVSRVTGRPKLEGTVLIIREAVYKKYWEERVRRAESLSVVGQLAAGMAHEIRNPLTAIRGFVQLIQKQLSGQKELDYYVRIILQEIDRANAIIQDFLKLSRSSTPRFQKVDVHTVLEEVAALTEYEAFFHNVKLHKSYTRDIPPIMADVHQLKQVFLNLISNSLAAMPYGGTVEIATSFNPASGEVVVAIRDTGTGMDEDTLARLGQPFFTTKENGTGLGLAISYQIIHQHGGRVQVQSAVGKGTTFSIYLPIKEAATVDACSEDGTGIM